MVFHDENGALRLGIDELLARGAACASVLQDRGIGAGDAVGVLGPNRPEWVSWALGVWLAGAAVVPLPAPVRVRDADAFALQIRSLVDGVGCSLIVAHPRFVSAVPDDRVMAWDAPTPAVTRAPRRCRRRARRHRDDPLHVGEHLGAERAFVSPTPPCSPGPAGRARSRLRGLSWLPLYHAGGHGRARRSRLRGLRVPRDAGRGVRSRPGFVVPQGHRGRGAADRRSVVGIRGGRACDRPPPRRRRPLERAVDAVLARDGRSRRARPVGRSVRSAWASARDLLVVLRPVRRRLAP